MTDNETKAIIEETDACFDTLPATAYKLIAEFCSNAFRLLVFDPEKNKFIAFAQKYVQTKSGSPLYLEQLKSFTDENKLFRLKYNDVCVIWETQRSTLVPLALFEVAEKGTYFHFNLGKESSEIIYSDKLKTTEVFNVFSIPDELKEIPVLKTFRICHHASVLIESIMIFSKLHMSSKLIMVNIHSAFFDMMISEKGKLLFYNTFSYKTPEDFIYFILFVYNQLNLSPERDGIILSGEVIRNSSLYEILNKYVRNIEFASAGEPYSNSYILRNIQPHTIYSIANSVLCEL